MGKKKSTKVVVPETATTEVPATDSSALTTDGVVVENDVNDATTNEEPESSVSEDDNVVEEEPVVETAIEKTKSTTATKAVAKKDALDDKLAKYLAGFEDKVVFTDADHLANSINFIGVLRYAIELDTVDAYTRTYSGLVKNNKMLAEKVAFNGIRQSNINDVTERNKVETMYGTFILIRQVRNKVVDRSGINVDHISSVMGDEFIKFIDIMFANS